MSKVFLYLLVLVALVAGTWFYGRQQTINENKTKCELINIGRRLTNDNTARHILLEKVVIVSNEKAQQEIPTYHFPKEIQELKKLPPLKYLPALKC